MVAFAVKNFGGEIPRTDSRLLPDNMAEAAWNVDTSSGALVGLPQPKLIHDFTALIPEPSPLPLRAYRIPDPNGRYPDVWLALPSPFSSVVTSPLTNDAFNRIYWTNPPTLPGGGDGSFKWTNYNYVAAGVTPFDVGFITPSKVTPLTVTASGGTPDTGVGAVPYVERSYLYTYIDEFGMESSPSAPSAVVAGASDGTWTITGFPTPVPGTTTDGPNYPPVVGIWIYRTATGASTGATFYRVAFIAAASGAAPPASYVDGTTDTQIVYNLTLSTQNALNPPQGLDGLVSMPGGFLCGFIGNTLYFSDPNLPNSWPAGYALSVHYPIQALSLWQQTLMIATQGFPSSGTGTSPDNFTLSTIEVAEPCVSRGSVVSDLLGTYYASQNGLVFLSYYGAQVQTQALISKKEWLTEFNAAETISCRHRAQYLAFQPVTTISSGAGLDNFDNVGFLIDYTDQRQGLVQLNPFLTIDSIWNDAYTGDAYVLADGKVYRWDDPTSPPLVYRWRSKQFYMPAPGNLGACQVDLTEDVYTAYAADPNVDAAAAHDPLLQLPAGVNAVFNLYVGGQQTPVLTMQLKEPRVIFRLPSGFKVFTYQFEIIARTPVKDVQLASTMEELKTV